SEKYFTASHKISQDLTVAGQVLWDRCANPADQALVRFIANASSQTVPPTISWNSLLESFQANAANGNAYKQARSLFVNKLKAGQSTDSEAETLRDTSLKLNHPLATIDTFRLLALRELVAGRNAWAESLFLQATEVAEQHGDLAQASELWLMVATTAHRSEQRTTAKDAWLKAIGYRATLLQQTDRPLDPTFWQRAETQRPKDTPWPSSITPALLAACQPVGCTLSSQSPAELVLWCAVATALYDDHQPQLALVKYKKAEAFAQDDNIMWLRIAQGKCLAALGQTHAAAAILSEPTASDRPEIAAAATATMGCAKLRSGAYQQAAELLVKALSNAPNTFWPARSEAEADLALARLILGDTDDGLDALHAAQQTFEMEGNSQSLLQSLENELRILEHEQRAESARSVRNRIREIEKAPVSTKLTG
ncbi:MAG: hypothetical protein MI861_16065, partial [Pirellulales bacterium]|nr:hypothetical protein [Pirellulales bacterium]